MGLSGIFKEKEYKKRISDLEEKNKYIYIYIMNIKGGFRNEKNS